MKILTKLLLAMFLMIVILPTKVIALTNYSLWVGGIQVTSTNASGVTGPGITGSVTYSPETNTLTLNDATITNVYVDGYNNAGGIYSSGDIKIAVTGTNTISVTPPFRGGGIFSMNGSVTISGSGSLEVTLGSSTAFNFGVSTFGMGKGISINGSTLAITSGATSATSNSTSSGLYSDNGFISIINATVTSNAGSSLQYSNGIFSSTLTVVNSTVIATGYNRAISSSITASDSILSASNDRLGTDAITRTVAEVQSGTYKYVSFSPMPDEVPPTLTSGSANRTSETEGTVKFSSDESGTYYYVVVADGELAPEVDTSGTGTIFNAGEVTIANPTGLTVGAKDIYIKVKDGSGNFSDTLKMDIPQYIRKVASWAELKTAVNDAPISTTETIIEITQSFEMDGTQITRFSQDSQSKNIAIQSATGGPYTITRAINSTDSFFALYNWSDSLTLRNIILDGNGSSVTALTMIYLENKSTIVLDNGAVIQNVMSSNQTGRRGGAVTNLGGNFTMKAGSLIKNSRQTDALGTGGVLNANGGKFIMEGGRIVGNEGGEAGGITSFSSISISGVVEISNNTKMDGTASNVYLFSSSSSFPSLINVSESGIQAGTEIGVTTNSTLLPVKITNANSADYSSYFISDNPIYTIFNSGTGSNQVLKYSTYSTYNTQHYHQNITGTEYTLFETESHSGLTGTTAIASVKTYPGLIENTTYLYRVASKTIAAGGTTLLKLYYDRNTYTVSYVSNSDSVLLSMTGIRYDATISAPLEPTKFGHTFAGWYKEAELINTFNFSTEKIVENTTLYAKWVVNSYSITFDSNGGSNVASIMQDFGTFVTVPENPTKVGYAFVGWYKEAELINTFNFSTEKIVENTTLYAKWTLNSYTITFDSDGGSSVASIIQSFGTAVTAPDNPTKTGYIFTGWSPALPTNMPASNTNLIATYSANINTAYKVEHYQEKMDGSYELKDTENLSGTTATNVTADAKAYPGFTENTTKTERVVSGSVTADGSTILKLYYDRNSYTVTFKDYNGSVLKTESVRYEESAIAPSSPSLEGYSFIGWDTVFNNVTSDLTVKARFDIKKYTVSFIDYDDRVIGSASIVEYGKDAAAPTTPTRFGYVFSAWDKLFNNVRSDLVIRALYSRLNDPFIIIKNNEIGVEADGLDESIAFTDQERLEEVSVELEIVVLEEKNVTTEDKVLIDTYVESTLKVSLPKLYFLDISLFKVVGNNRTAIQNAESEITIRFILPEALRGIEFSVIRVHEEQVEQLIYTYNEETFEVSFKTDKFSTYSIVGVSKVDEDLAPEKPIEEVISNTSMLRNILIALGGVLISIVLFFVIWKRRKQGEEA